MNNRLSDFRCHARNSNAAISSPEQQFAGDMLFRHSPPLAIFPKEAKAKNSMTRAKPAVSFSARF